MNTVLVTGACQGLGLCVAEAFARKKWQIAGVDIEGTKLENAMEKLATEHKVETRPIVADVSTEEEVISAVKKTIDTFGQIDVLVNNAGIREIGAVWETSSESWDRTMGINLWGQFLFAREVLKQYMLDAGEGKIVFMSSIAGRRGTAGSTAYSVSKWGIRGLAASVAQDVKSKGINVTVVTPGRTDTPMARESEKWNPDIGWLSPNAVANSILWFSEQESSVEIPEIHLHHSEEL